MKNLFKYALLLVAAAGFVACAEKEVEDTYTPGKEDSSSCYGVSFPKQDATGSHTFDPEAAKSMTFTAKRTNTVGDIIVPVEIVDTAGVFQVDDIVFADGQDETTFDITFDDAKLGVNYGMTLSVSDPEYASIYGAGVPTFNFDVLVVTWVDFLNPVTKEPAVITLTEGWWGETHTATMKYYEVAGLRTCFIASNETDADGNPTGIWGDTENIGLTFKWYVEDQGGFGHKNNLGYDFLEVPKQYFGFDYADWKSKPEAEAANPIYVYDYPWYWVERGYAFDGGDMGTCWLDEANRTGNTDGNYPVGYYDGNGGFFFNLRYYIPGLGGFSPPQYDVVGIAEGFDRRDYTVKAIETDYSADGETPVYVETGKEVQYIKYALYPGELTSTQALNKAPLIADGTDDSVKFDELILDAENAVKYVVLNVAPETSGLYTFVAVTFDEEDNAQDAGYVVINHIAADDQDLYAVKVEVGTEEISARYEAQGLSPINSFGYWITGEDLTEVHVGVVKTATYESNTALYDDTVRSTAGLAVSDADLAKINTAGGATFVASGLDPLTDYTVLVWAGNGNLETIATATYTTDGLPLELVTKGTYTYDAWWGGADDEQELYIDPNYENTYVLPNWGGGVNFTFTLDPATGEITIPTFYIGADHSTYGSVYYVDPFNWWTSPQEDETRLVHSYLDEYGVYNFHFVLAVSAGSFGHFWESFTPEGVEVPAGAPKKPAAVGMPTFASHKLPGMFIERDARFGAIARDVKPVDANARVSNAGKPAKKVDTRLVSFDRVK